MHFIKFSVTQVLYITICGSKEIWWFSFLIHIRQSDDSFIDHLSLIHQKQLHLSAKF